MDDRGKRMLLCLNCHTRFLIQGPTPGECPECHARFHPPGGPIIEGINTFLLDLMRRKTTRGYLTGDIYGWFDKRLPWPGEHR